MQSRMIESSNAPLIRTRPFRSTCRQMLCEGSARGAIGAGSAIGAAAVEEIADIVRCGRALILTVPSRRTGGGILTHPHRRRRVAVVPSRTMSRAVPPAATGLHFLHSCHPEERQRQGL